MTPTCAPPTPPVGHPYRAVVAIVPHNRPWWVPLVASVLQCLRVRLSTERRLQRRLLGGHWERLHCGDFDTTVADRWVRVDDCRRKELPIMTGHWRHWLECEGWK